MNPQNGAKPGALHEFRRLSIPAREPDVGSVRDRVRQTRLGGGGSRWMKAGGHSRRQRWSGPARGFGACGEVRPAWPMREQEGEALVGHLLPVKLLTLSRAKLRIRQPPQDRDFTAATNARHAQTTGPSTTCKVRTYYEYFHNTGVSVSFPDPLLPIFLLKVEDSIERVDESA